MKDQMELALNQSRRIQARARRERRLRRAQWWFDQMRQVVDQALDRPAKQGRPEQIYFRLSRESQPN